MNYIWQTSIMHSINDGMIVGSIFGSVIGFVIFVIMLESPRSGNILWRNNHFRWRGLYNYIKSPFISQILWYRQVWIHNWIIMSMSCSVVGSVLGGIIHSIYS